MGAAAMVDAQAEAMKAAAENAGGAMMGFMGMGMAQAAGGMNAASLYDRAESERASARTIEIKTTSKGENLSPFLHPLFLTDFIKYPIL